jgi:hypothetical protein
MRVHFARATATRPTAYRRTFRGRPLEDALAEANSVSAE